MRRLGWGIILVLLGLSLPGCGPVEPVSESSPANSATQETVAVPPEAQAMYRYLRARMDLLAGDSGAAHEHYKEAARHDPSSALLRARLAKSYLGLGEVDNAVVEAEAAVRLDGEDLESRRLLAGLYGGTGKVSEGIREYRKVLEIAPDDAQTLLYLGAIRLGQGQFGPAREHLERYTRRNPGSPLGHYYLGRILAESRELVDAEKSYATALKLYPRSAPVLAELGLVHEFRGRSSAALETYEKLLKVDPGNDWAGRRLEAFRSGRRDLAEARAEFDRLRSREAAPGVARMKMALVHYELGNLEDAVTEFSLALAERPGDGRVRFFAGLTYARLEDREAAARHFERIPEDSEYFVDSRVQLASVYEKQERFPEAVTAIRAALEKDDRRRKELFRLLAEVYRQAKDFPNAIKAMHTVVELDPRSDRVHFALGALYDESKDKDKTIEYMQKAIELNPDYAAALNYLGYTYADLGVELDRAEQLIIRALEIRPNDGFYIDSLGWVYYRKGEFRKAIEQLEKAVHLVVDDPVIIEHLGDAYLKVGEPGKALRSYREALESADEDEQLERIRSKIGELEPGI